MIDRKNNPAAYPDAQLWGLMQQVKSAAWNAMQMMDDATPELLKASGHSTKEEAIIYLFRRARERIVDLQADHLKRHPDI